MGRPTLYSQEVVGYICQELAKGLPLTVICRGGMMVEERADPENDEYQRPEVMPKPRTVQDWEAERDDVSAAIARARELGEFALAEECLEIADDGRRDYSVDKDGREVPDHDHINRTKLRIETRLKLLAKFNPRRWGDKLELAGSKDSPLTVVVRKFGDA
jgi:hypothetical protein